MNEIRIGDSTYQIGKLPAMTQFHVVRRVGPVIATMGNTVTKLMANGGNLGDEGNLMQVMGVVSEVVAKMSDADVEYVIYACLAQVKRKQGERFAPFMTGNQFMFQADTDMQLMMRLTFETLRENLGSFFPVPPDAASMKAG